MSFVTQIPIDPQSLATFLNHVNEFEDLSTAGPNSGTSREHHAACTSLPRWNILRLDVRTTRVASAAWEAPEEC